MHLHARQLKVKSVTMFVVEHSGTRGTRKSSYKAVPRGLSLSEGANWHGLRMVHLRLLSLISHAQTRTEYHHASSQTEPRQRGDEASISRFHRETQTVVQQTRSQQSVRMPPVVARRAADHS